MLDAQNELANSVERLSSGIRINSASDDAAGLGVAESLSMQINGANQGIQNINDGISMVQTAEGALSTVSDMAQRMLALATQGANDTLGQDQKKSIANEINQLKDSINSVASRTQYTGTSLFSGVGQSIQVSNNANDNIQITSDQLADIGIQPSSSQGTVLDGSGSGTQTISNLNNLPAGSDPRTYSGWVKLYSTSITTSSTGTIVAQGTIDPATFYHRSALLLVPDSSIANGAQVVLDFQVGNVRTAALPILDNKWHMISVTYDKSATGTGVTFYVDGQLIPGSPGANGFDKNAVNTINSSNSATFGYEFGVTNGATDTSKTDSKLIGRIDDVSIWNRALSASEIGNLYSLPSTIPAGLVTEQYISDGYHSVSDSESGAASIGNDLYSKITTLMTASSNSSLTADVFTQIESSASSYLSSITKQRGNLGAMQNQLGYTISNLTTLSANLQAAKSRVLDTDYAQETAKLTKAQILQHATAAMLAQANQMPNVILTLLK
jgi:flagellin